MPFYVSEFIGGLGNQIFSVVAAYSFAKKYNTTFSINKKQEFVQLKGFQCPIYCNSILKSVIESSLYNEQTIEKCKDTITINCVQFTDITIPDTIDPTTTCIILKGLPMKYNVFEECLQDLQDLFYKQKDKNDENKLTNISNDKIKVGVMFRTFFEEKTPQFRCLDSYYYSAIDLILTKYHDKTDKLQFHIYTDEEGVTNNIIKPYITSKNINIEYIECVGKRDQHTDVKHFFDMFDLDDYILCNSTYHYWSALFSKQNLNKLVTYPMMQNDGDNCGRWFTLLSPSSWVCI